VGTVSTIGPQRVNARGYRVPSSGRFDDEDALDAGTVILEIDQALAHHCFQSPRHLAWDLGEDEFLAVSDNSLVGYESVITMDVTPPVAGAVSSSWQKIPWDLRVARRFGPFALVPDVGDRPVNGRPRSVRVVYEVVVPSGLTNCKAVAVMTRGSGADEIFSDRYIAAFESATVASGTQTVRFDLDPPTTFTVDGSYPTSRAILTSATGSTQVRLRTFWLWVGFFASDNTATAVESLSISVYETRE
jgi:hypothetical protein